MSKKKLKHQEKALFAKIAQANNRSNQAGVVGYTPEPHEANFAKGLLALGYIKPTAPGGDTYVTTRKGTSNVN